MPSRPPTLIAVTGRVFPMGRIERVLEPQVAAPTWYLESIARGGGLGCLLNPSQLEPDEASAVVSRFDGLCVLGGGDVDPSLYGQEPDRHTYGADLLLDRFDITLLEAAVAADRPVLAICRGHQVLNVARGGTLHQHIVGRLGLVAHGIPNGGGGSEVKVDVSPGTRLAEALGENPVTGRCHHHQAVDEVGHGLTVTARATDGTVEALELDGDGWVVAVQWHPEETTHEDPAQQRLFTTFVAEAAERAARRR